MLMEVFVDMMKNHKKFCHYSKDASASLFFLKKLLTNKFLSVIIYLGLKRKYSFVRSGFAIKGYLRWYNPLLIFLSITIKLRRKLLCYNLYSEQQQIQKTVGLMMNVELVFLSLRRIIIIVDN